jgi:hypothetical protein
VDISAELKVRRERDIWIGTVDAWEDMKDIRAPAGTRVSLVI